MLRAHDSHLHVRSSGGAIPAMRSFLMSAVLIAACGACGPDDLSSPNLPVLPSDNAGTDAAMADAGGGSGNTINPAADASTGGPVDPPDTGSDTGAPCQGPGCPGEPVAVDCSNQPCVVGRQVCLSASELRRCVADGRGCGIWATPEMCPGGGTCKDGACATCQDVDRDGFGAGCGAGTDCNDTDPRVHDGAPELCDGKDNDCDGTIDEGFTLGSYCYDGRGECRREGETICAPDGQDIACSAVPGPPQTEVCDGKDNDCDEVVDSVAACGSTCVDDRFEPNDTNTAGAALALNAELSAKLCPGNANDWFRLGNLAQGTTVRVDLAFLRTQGDLDMEIYIGGTYAGGSYGVSSNESITLTLPRAGNTDVRIYAGRNVAQPMWGTPYTVKRAQ